MQISPAPKGFNYDIRGLFFFEVFPDGRINHIPHDRYSIRHKDVESLYGAYHRAAAGECTLFFSLFKNESETMVWRVEHLDELADSIGILRPNGHIHDIHAALSPRDPGKGRYADLDIELRCGCTLCSANKRAFAEYCKEKYGWEIILNSIGYEPLSKRTIRVERNSVCK